jgi:hypothetical protein
MGLTADFIDGRSRNRQPWLAERREWQSSSDRVVVVDRVDVNARRVFARDPSSEGSRYEMDLDEFVRVRSGGSVIK